MLEELVQELNLNEEQSQKLEDAVTKLNQSSNDKIRTEYSQKLRELEQYKPVEKSDAEIELESLKKELAETKFQKSLKDIGVSDDLGKYLRSDIDLEAFKEIYKGLGEVNKDFIPNNNMGDNSITKEQFKAMGIAERTKLYETNPELYNQLKQL